LQSSTLLCWQHPHASVHVFLLAVPYVPQPEPGTSSSRRKRRDRGEKSAAKPVNKKANGSKPGSEKKAAKQGKKKKAKGTNTLAAAAQEVCLVVLATSDTAHAHGAQRTP
jgi:hypothetical protein